MKKTILVLIILLTGLFFFGCTQPPVTPNTCSQQNGFSCNDNQTCDGTLLSASNTAKCCSVACTSPSLTCTAQNGFTCTENQTCSETLLTATDSNNCCSIQCTTPIPTCNQQKGAICPTEQICDGNFSPASDTDSCCISSCIAENDLAKYNWADKVEPEIRLGSSTVRYYYAELGGNGMQLDNVTYLFNNDSTKPQEISNIGLKIVLIDSDGTEISEYTKKYFNQSSGFNGTLGKIYGMRLSKPVSFPNLTTHLKVTVPGEYTLKSIFYDVDTNNEINSLNKKISFGYSVPFSLEATKARVNFIEKPEATIAGTKITITRKEDNIADFKITYSYDKTMYLIAKGLFINDKNGLINTDITNSNTSGTITIPKDNYNPQKEYGIIINFYNTSSNKIIDYIAIKAK